MGEDLGTIETDPVECRVGEGIAVHELNPIASVHFNSLVIP
jgi:hypothetical protein